MSLDRRAFLLRSATRPACWHRPRDEVTFAALDVVAGDRAGLVEALRALSARARQLTQGTRRRRRRSTSRRPTPASSARRSRPMR